MTLKFSLIFIVALFLVAPFIFIEFNAVVDALVFESRSTHLGADSLGWWGNLLYYVDGFDSWSNFLSIIFLGFGVIAIFKWKNNQTLILFFGALYWVLLSLLSLHWERWALPMYITPLFLVAIGITFIWEMTKNFPFLKFSSMIIFILFLTFQFIFSLHTSIRMVFVDTRVKALNELTKYDISLENSIFEGYTPFYSHGPKMIFEDLISKSEDFNHIILSSFMYDRYYQEPERYSQEIMVYDLIRRDHHLIAKFEPSPSPENSIQRMDDILFYVRRTLGQTTGDRFRGPVIEIYRVKQ